jgi:hypothetical protein
VTIAVDERVVWDIIGNNKIRVDGREISLGGNLLYCLNGLLESNEPLTYHQLQDKFYRGHRHWSFIARDIVQLGQLVNSRGKPRVLVDSQTPHGHEVRLWVGVRTVDHRIPVADTKESASIPPVDTLGSISETLGRLRLTTSLNDEQQAIEAAEIHNIDPFTVMNILNIHRLSEALLEAPLRLDEVIDRERIDEYAKVLTAHMEARLLMARNNGTLSTSELVLIGLHLRLDPSMASLQGLVVGTSQVTYRVLYERTAPGRRSAKEGLSKLFGMKLDLFEKAYTRALVRLRQQDT